MPGKMPEDEDLDTFFAAAKALTPAPSAALTARILAQAEAEQPRRIASVKRPRPGFWSGLVAALGGAPGLAGLSASVLAGFWIGFAEPAPLDDLTRILGVSTQTDAIDLLPDFDDIASEG